MSLELFQIVILIGIGALVGISISIAGQTGQGVVLPIVLLFTGDVFLAIAINLLNDLITTLFASIRYVKNREFKIRVDIFLIIVIAVFVSFFGVFILMTTPLGTIYGWFIPAFIIVLGLLFIKQGFPTNESLKKMIEAITKKTKKDSNLNDLNKVLKEDVDNNQAKSLHKRSKLFFLLALFFGSFIGVNSGMFGAASGLIFVLALVIIYGYPLKKAVGTALILSIFICLSTFIIYQALGIYLKGRLFLNIEISIYLAIGSIFTAIITSFYIQKISAKTMGRAIGFIIAILGSISLTIYFIS
jgi:uncharacterized membrane protein YfcA